MNNNIIKYIESLDNTILVSDLSADERFKKRWISGTCFYTSPLNNIAYSFLFSIKTDSFPLEKWEIFIDININGNTDNGIIWSQAEYFLYYNIDMDRLLFIPVFPLREWYYSDWISKVTTKIERSNWDVMEWILLSIDELLAIIPFMEIKYGISTLWNITSNS